MQSLGGEQRCDRGDGMFMGRARAHMITRCEVCMATFRQKNEIAFGGVLCVKCTT